MSVTLILHPSCVNPKEVPGIELLVNYCNTVEPGVSKLFGKRKKVYYRQVVYYLAGDLCWKWDFGKHKMFTNARLFTIDKFSNARFDCIDLSLACTWNARVERKRRRCSFLLMTAFSLHGFLQFFLDRFCSMTHTSKPLWRVKLLLKKHIGILFNFTHIMYIRGLVTG